MSRAGVQEVTDLYQYFIGFSNAILNTFGPKLPYESKPRRLADIHNVVGPGCTFDQRSMDHKMSASSLDTDGEIPIVKVNEKKNQLPRTFQKPDEQDSEALLSLQWAVRHGREKYFTTQYNAKLWVKSEDEKKVNMCPFGDYVVHIRVHKPSTLESKYKKSYQPAVQEEVLMLSSQPLCALRDIIMCPNKFSTTGTKSDNPSQSANMEFAKDLFPSAFFYIENTFYNDMRKPGCSDLSKVIREWAAKSKRFPDTDFRVANMEGVTLRDLKLKMGFPYLFKHLGSCEHVVTFVNAKLIGKSDDLNPSHYPMRRMPFSFPSHKLCLMCGFFNAVWVTTGNEFAPHDPAYFCNHCFHAFNFVDGKRTCDFTSYPLLNPRNLPKVANEDPIPQRAQQQGEGQEPPLHPLLFTPRNIHHELVVDPGAKYPPQN